MATRPLSLPAWSTLVVLGAGFTAVLGLAAVGFVSFMAMPGAEAAAGLVGPAQRSFLLSLGLIGTFFVALAALVAWLSARAVSDDVHFVTRRVHDLARRGELGEPVSVRTLDEVGQLVRSFEELRQAYLEQISRDRAAREKAQEADRYTTEFLNTVSHELRTPLNSILGFSQVLVSGIEGPLLEAQRDSLRNVEESGHALLELFNRALDLSALTSGRLDLVVERVDVAEVLQETVRMLQGQRRGRAIEISSRVEGDLPPLRADPMRLRQIVTNLATNALKFTSEGRVSLSAALEDDRLHLRVQDTGPGIAEDQLSLIFQEFTQAGGAARAPHGGAGLGLSICRQLTELHGGRIWAESTLGQGSTFHVSLPMNPAARPSRPSIPLPPVGAGP